MKTFLFITLTTLLLFGAHGSSCPDASFQSVKENSVQCKSVCFGRDFLYFQLSGVFCFCSNSNTCTGFEVAKAGFPVALYISVSDGYIAEPIQVGIRIELAVTSFSGSVQMIVDGESENVMCSDGACNFDYQKTYLKPGHATIRASVTNDGLTVSNTTSLTVHCKMNIGDQLPAGIVGESGTTQLLSIQLITGYNVHVKVLTDKQMKYSFLIMDPKVLESGYLFVSGSETRANTLYLSDLLLYPGYLYGVQIRAVTRGVIQLRVYCGVAATPVNTTTVALTPGVNSIILTPLLLEEDVDCFVGVLTDAAVQLCVRNTAQNSETDGIIGELSLIAFTSQPRDILIPVHWDQPGSHVVSFLFTSFDAEVDNSISIEILDRIEGLTMSVTHSGTLHEFKTGAQNQLTVTVQDSLDFAVEVEKGSSVEYTWTPPLDTLSFDTLGTFLVSVSADNLLKLPETVKATVIVTDEEFQLSDLNVVSEVLLTKDDVLYLLSGAEVHFSCDIIGGTGLTVILYPDSDPGKTLHSNMNNKGSTYTSTYTHTYSSPLTTTSPKLCVSNSVSETCAEFPIPVSVVEHLQKPVIDIPEYVDRGQVLIVEADVEADSYLWTKNVPKMEMKLTANGLEFEDEFVDTDNGNDRTFSVYFSEIGEVTLGLYVYNTLSWKYAEKTVFVELEMSDVPVALSPQQYIKTGESVTITLNCPPSITHKVLIETSVSTHTAQCDGEAVRHLTQFDSAGVYSMLVKTFNNISSSDKTYTVVVQDVVEINFTVGTVGISPAHAVGVNSEVGFTAVSSVAFVPQSDLSVSWIIDSSEIDSEELVSETPIADISSFSYEFNEIGPHNVSCCIYNKVSEVCTTLPFNVLTRVSGLVLTYANSSYDISPGQAAHIRVSVKEGSEVQVDGIIEGETIIVPISNKQGTLQHVFELAGVYSVSVTAYNDISSSVKQLPSYIYVQNPVTGVEILDHSSNNQELNDSTLKTDEVHMDVYIEGGTNTTVRCDFGEDTSSVITVEVHHSPYDAPVVNINQTIRCSYSYKTTGIFVPLVRVSNSISFTDIPPAKLPIFTVEVPIEDSFINIPNTIEVGQSLELKYSLVAGSNVGHEWFIDGEPYGEAVYRPILEGNLNITLKLKNNLDSLTLSKIVTVETILQSVQLAENLGDFHKLTEIVEINLVLTPPAKYNVTYSVDMGDGTVYKTPVFSHQYPDIGLYTISISAQNSISSTSLTKSLDVQDEILRVSIRGSFMLLARQLSTFYAHVHKTSTVQLEKNVQYVWQINGNVQEQNAPDISVLLEDVGTYTLRVSVSNRVSEQNVSETLVVTTTEECRPPEARIVGDDYIAVQAVDTVSLEAVIISNCDSRHDIWWSILTLDRRLVQNFTDSSSKSLTFRASVVDPGQYIARLVVSVEGFPDLYRSHEVLLKVEAVFIIPVLNYPTFTTTNTKETLEISLADSLVMGSGLTIDQFTFNWNCKFEPSQATYDPCLAVESKKTPYISVNFNTSGFAHITPIISLNYKVVATSEIVLNVTNFVVPLVKIFVDNIHQLSPEDRTVASLQCSDRDGPCFQPTIYWQISKLSQSVCESIADVDSETTFTLTSDMTTTGLHQGNLVVQGGSFQVGGSYKLEGCVWKGVCGGELLDFPCGPSQGSCDVKIVSGRTVEVVCIDWISQRGQLIYHVTYTSSLYPVVAYSGPQATSRFILPAGENSVTVVVSNSAGTRTVLQPELLSIPSDSDISINTTDLINRNEYPMVLQIINSELEYPNDEESDSDSPLWNSDLKKVLTGMNNPRDIDTYLSSLGSTVAKFISTYSNEVGLNMFIDFLEMLSKFLKDVLAGECDLPHNSLEIILELSNKLLNLTQQLFGTGEQEAYLSLFNKAYSLSDEVTALLLTIKLNGRVAGEEDLVRKQQAVGVVARKLDKSSFQGEVFEESGYKFALPRTMDLDHQDCLQGHMILYDESPYGTLDPVSSHVSSLTLRYCNGSEVNVANTKEAITITLPINKSKATTESVFSILTHKRLDNSTTNEYKVEKQANIHRIDLAEYGALNIQISCMDVMTNVPLNVMIGVNLVPNEDDYLRSGIVERDSTISFNFPAEELAKFDASEMVVSVTNYENPELPYSKQTPPTVRKYSVQYWYSHCLYRTSSGWSDEGCTSSKDSSPTEAVCECSHLTLFASKHFTTPNKLDIGTIITTRSLEDGHVILTLTCVLLFVYLVTLTVFVKLDILRGSTSSVIYLEDNYVRDKQGYLVRIVTGSQPNAGTTARVNIKLYGKQRESPARLLSAQRPLFAYKSRESFVMKFPTSLGKIHHIHIWHDNSGKDPSWFLENVTITDLNSNRTRYFPCHEWLAVEEGDGNVEKMIPSSKSPYKTRWDAFISNACFAEHHLWGSLFKDHTYANFSKPQRLTVGFTFLFLAMAANVAFWNPALDTTFDFTIFNIGSDVMSQGLVSSLIVLPFIIGVIVLFRRSQTRMPLLVYPDSTKVLSQSSMQDSETPTDDQNNAGLASSADLKRSNIPENPTSQFLCDASLALPWWCSILAWILCFLVITCSVVLTTLYGIQFGNNKSLQWLASFGVSIIESVFISQPFIVLGCGIYATLTFGKKKNDGSISKTDTMTLNYMLPRNFTTKAYEGLARVKAFRFRSTKPPPHKSTILAAREECLRRKELSELVNCLLLHVYLLVVVLLAANSSLPDSGHWNVYGIKTAFSGRTRPEFRFPECITCSPSVP